MDLLYLGNFGIHQWFEWNWKPCGCIVNPGVDLLYLSNFDIHQWFLGRIANPVLVL